MSEERIDIEGEPWIGLVVVADTGRDMKQPSYFGLAPASEWHSKSDPVTLWRCPKMKDYRAVREHLIERMGWKK